MYDINPNNYSGHPFEDVSANAYYRGYVAWAYQTGVINGVDATHFEPEKYIERQAFAKILYCYNDKFAKLMPQNKAKSTYADDASIASWAKDYVYSLQSSGALSGYNGGAYFSPTNNLTRAEAATAMFKFYLITTLFKSGSSTTPVPSGTQDAINKGEAKYGDMPYIAKLMANERLNIFWLAAKAGAGLARERGLDVAADQLVHFLDNTGKTYTNYPVARMIGENKYNPHSEYFVSYMNKIKTAAECYATPGKSIAFSSRTEAGFDLVGSDKNWAYSLGYYRFYISCYVTQTGSNQYSIEDGKYFVRDYYDWDPNSKENILDLAVSSLWELHYAGEAKNYNVTGALTFSMKNWQGGSHYTIENWTFNY